MHRPTKLAGSPHLYTLTTVKTVAEESDRYSHGTSECGVWSDEICHDAN